MSREMALFIIHWYTGVENSHAPWCLQALYDGESPQIGNLMILMFNITAIMFDDHVVL